MNPLDFLRAVLPSAGHGLYCAMSGKTKKHVFVEQVEDLQPQFERMVEREHDAYFALATYATDESRKASNARYLRSLFIDMDGYETPQDAWAELRGFLRKTGLAEVKPWLVTSGGGLHAYWPFTRDLEVFEWEPIARNFKRLCEQEGLKIDKTVTADAARILRPPGTFNYKPVYPEPRPVELVKPGGFFDPDDFGQRIADLLVGVEPARPTAQVLMLPGERPATAVANIMLFANSETRFRTILEKTVDGEGCGQLSYYLQNAQEEGMEPLWRGLLSIAKKCDDNPEQWGWRLSQLHPYDAERFERKWSEIKGPYPCKWFAENGVDGVCANCKHKGKITNPLALGRAVLTTTEEKTFEEPADEPVVPEEVSTIGYTRPEAPYPFTYGQRGGIFVKGDKDDDMPVMVLPYDLFIVGLFRDEEKHHYVRLYANHPMGARNDIIISAKVLASKDETAKALNEANIVAASAEKSKTLAAYLQLAYSAASTNKKAQALPEQFGWQPDGTFVVGGKVYRKGVQPIEVPMPNLTNVVRATQVKGSIEGWCNVLNTILIPRRMHAHLAVMLFGLAAPLMRYCGANMSGLTVHCASTNSGTGKSLAIDLAASIWGSPTLYRTPKGTSLVAMQQRLGMLQNLPLVTDEVTSKTRDKETVGDWLPTFLLDMTQGRGKERMESGTNRERLNTTTWSTIALMSSNTHWTDLLTSDHHHSAEGELRRLLEFKIDDVMTALTPEEEGAIRALYDNHHGAVGAAMAQYFVDNEHTLAEEVRTSTEYIKERFKASGDERYWIAGIGAMLASGVMLKRAGIISLPMDVVIKVCEDVVKYMREAVAAGKKTAEGVLASFVTENYGKMLILTRGSDSQWTAQLGGMSDIRDESITKSSVMGRIERDLNTGWTDICIEEKVMKAHCAAVSFAYSDFKKEMVTKAKVTTHAHFNMMKSTRLSARIEVNIIRIGRQSNEADDLIQAPPAVDAA